MSLSWVLSIVESSASKSRYRLHSLVRRDQNFLTFDCFPQIHKACSLTEKVRTAFLCCNPWLLDRHCSFDSRFTPCDCCVWGFSRICRYFLRKLRKVKKANGQILSVNEVSHTISHSVSDLKGNSYRGNLIVSLASLVQTPSISQIPRSKRSANIYRDNSYLNIRSCKLSYHRLFNVAWKKGFGFYLHNLILITC